MLEKCDWTKYLINISNHNYQTSNVCTVTFVFDFFFSSCNLIVTRLFNFDDFTKENLEQYNSNWPEILNHLYRILIVAGSDQEKQIYYSIL